MQLPLFETKSDWVPPVVSALPCWTGAKRVGIDIETYDPHLKELGPSVRRGGFIAGVSFSIEDGPTFYLPMRHEGGGNLEEERVMAYLKDQAQVFLGTLVGANLNYDLDYLAEAGVTFPKIKWQRDVQVADPVIWELHNSYKLDAVGRRWGFEGKEETLLKEALSNYGLKGKGDIWRLPARYVGAYAEEDARLPLQILRRQERKIDEVGLWSIYDLECRVQPVILKMRRRGVRIDLQALERVRRWALGEEEIALEAVRRQTGIRIPAQPKEGEHGVMAKRGVVNALKKIGATLGETPTGQPQVDAEVLERIDHPVATAILRARKANKLRTTFVESIRDHLVGDRIHCNFNQLRRWREDGNEMGGRFRMSSDHPNLQQQPTRDEMAKVWRTIYVPDEPSQKWAKADYSQQEPRMIVHFAERKGFRGAKKAGDRYRTDPATDYHQMMADMCGIPRKPAKDLFLGVCYGMGSALLAKTLGLPTKWIKTRRGYTIEVAGEEAEALLNKFRQRVPFVSALANSCKEVASRRGYIKTLLGRHCHFPKDEEGNYDWTHKGLNYLIQPSAADQTKLAMVEVDKAGLPLQLQVHDELDTSINTLEEGRAIKDIMENCVELTVPSKVDLEVGPSWGEVA